jgi:hypothetical protein
MCYCLSTRIKAEWEKLRAHHPRHLMEYMKKGYMELISTASVRSRGVSFRIGTVIRIQGPIGPVNTQATSLDICLHTWL